MRGRARVRGMGICVPRMGIYVPRIAAEFGSCTPECGRARRYVFVELLPSVWCVRQRASPVGCAPHHWPSGPVHIRILLSGFDVSRRYLYQVHAWNAHIELVAPVAHSALAGLDEWASARAPRGGDGPSGGAGGMRKRPPRADRWMLTDGDAARFCRFIEGVLAATVCVASPPWCARVTRPRATLCDSCSAAAWCRRRCARCWTRSSASRARAWAWAWP